MSEQSVEMDAQADFVVPKIPLKKAPSSQQNAKATINKISSLIAPTDDYAPPSWAELPDSSDHTIEVMNNGVIAANHNLKDLAKKSYLTIGRMDTCDIQANIPGASRLHCYLQFGDGFDGRGWYVFDKASTQGTFVNKKEVPKSIYYKARAGSIIQITKSNFHLFLDGTDEKAKPENPDTLELKSPEPNFIDELKARTARSFEKDPIGVLSRFCEREGLEFKLSRVTSDDKEIVAYTFDLPDDVTSGNGGSFNGQGSDALTAQRNCAHQVCRHLNEHGLLDGGIQRERKKMEDFYEDGEDEFFDRTGQLEAQRLKRIERHKAIAGIKEKAMTHSELLVKIRQLEDSRDAVTEQLDRLIKPQDGVKVAPDEIDVSSLNASLSIRLEISKLKRKYEQLTGEINLMQKAAEISKPIEYKLPAERQQFKFEDAVSINDRPTVSSPPKMDDQSSTSELLTTNQKDEMPSDASTSQAEQIKGPALPPPKPKKDEKSDLKSFGLLTRKDLQANKNAKANKRKAIDEEDDVLDDEVDDKRNKTEEFEDPTDVVNWTAPSGQTGDGRTKLNDKFGGRY